MKNGAANYLKIFFSKTMRPHLQGFKDAVERNGHEIHVSPGDTLHSRLIWHLVSTFCFELKERLPGLIFRSDEEVVKCFFPLREPVK